MIIPEEDVNSAFDRIQNMSDEELLDFDPVCLEIHRYFSKHKPRKGGFVVPNRISALVALEAAYAYERISWEVE